MHSGVTLAPGAPRLAWRPAPSEISKKTKNVKLCYIVVILNLKKLCVFKAIRREKAKNSGSLATDKENLLVHR